MTSERIKAVGESTPPLSIGFDVAIAMCRRADVLGHPYPSPELRVWLANQITIAVNAARSSSPTPDGVIKERGEEGRDPSGPGSREPSPSVSASGFDPSRLMTAKWLDPQCISSGCQSLLWRERYQDACRGRREFREAFRRVRRQLRELERARDEQPKAENPKGLSPQGASPVGKAEAPASLVQPPSSQESGVGDPGRDDWCYDMDLAPRDHTHVLLTVPNQMGGNRDHVGEARFNSEANGGTWWWAGESEGDYYAEPISAPPIAWRYLPAPAAPRPSQREG